jgi:hypothetical protein
LYKQSTKSKNYKNNKIIKQLNINNAKINNTKTNIKIIKSISPHQNHYLLKKEEINPNNPIDQDQEKNINNTNKKKIKKIKNKKNKNKKIKNIKNKNTDQYHQTLALFLKKNHKKIIKTKRNTMINKKIILKSNMLKNKSLNSNK